MQLIGQAPTEVTDLTQILIQRFEMRAGDEFARHEHRHHQLSWAPDGVLTAVTDVGCWALPPTEALWLPSMLPHRLVCPKAATFHNVCFLPERCPVSWATPTVVPVTALLRALILHLVDVQLPEAERCRAESVVFDQLLAGPGDGIAMPLPSDPRALEVAHALLADPGDNRTIDQWGREVGASRRTLARRFVAETGLTFSDWRAQLRVRAAVDHLANGASITTTALRVGYRDASTFIAVFHRRTGRTPGAYAAAHRSDRIGHGAVAVGGVSPAPGPRSGGTPTARHEPR